MTTHTKEPQYQSHIEMAEQLGLAKLPVRASVMWRTDPRLLVFTLSRYKFVSKMLSGKNRVLEVGCGDAFGARIVQQEVGSLCASDFDPLFIEAVRQNMEPEWLFDCVVHDMLAGPMAEKFDAAYALDVIEHIPEQDELAFIGNMAASLKEHGVMIIGQPSLESQAYASEGSKAGHVNCKTGKGLRRLMKQFFHNVFIFSMNDEVVHTGFAPMAHYLFALCTDRKAAP
jgi:2-polyprenyl-3-methyl-5-hydroxy-6-metoxy-1,4-benzoquinol methylase